MDSRSGILHRESLECRRHSPRLETDIRPAAFHQCSGGAQENKVTKVSKLSSTRIRRMLAGERGDFVNAANRFAAGQ